MTAEIVKAFTGRGRLFDGTFKIAAPDTDDALRLNRDLTILAILSWDAAAQSGTAGTIIDREGRPFRLQIGAFDDADRAVILDWLGDAGAAAVSEEITVSPGFQLVAVTRRIVSADLVVVRFFLEGQLFDEVEIDEATVGAGAGVIDRGPSGGDVTIGDGLHGVIDSLAVLAREADPEEIRLTYERIFDWHERGGQIVRALVPVGAAGPVFSEAPDSDIQRELAVEGDAIGEAYAAAARLRAMLPDRAYGAVLDKWARTVGARQKVSDSPETRRDRVKALLGSDRGFSAPDVRTELAGMLDQDAEDVDLRRFSNLVDVDFNSSDIPRGFTRAPGGGSISHDPPLALSGDPTALEWSADARDAARVVRAISGRDGVDITAKLSDAISNSVDGFVVGGVALIDPVTQELFVFGAVNAVSAGYYIHAEGATTIDTASGGIGALDGNYPVWVRVRHVGGRSYEVMWSFTGADSGFTTPELVEGGPADPRFAGVALVGAADSAIGSSITVDTLRIWDREGHAPYTLIAYRDLSLAGDPDLVGARETLRRQAHSDVEAAVATELEFSLGSSSIGETPYDAEEAPSAESLSGDLLPLARDKTFADADWLPPDTLDRVDAAAADHLGALTFPAWVGVADIESQDGSLESPGGLSPLEYIELEGTSEDAIAWIPDVFAGARWYGFKAFLWGDTELEEDIEVRVVRASRDSESVLRSANFSVTGRPDGFGQIAGAFPEQLVAAPIASEGGTPVEFPLATERDGAIRLDSARWGLRIRGAAPSVRIYAVRFDLRWD